MLRVLALSTSALAMIAGISLPSAFAADPAAGAAAKKQCNELVAFYDRWGATRSEHTDGSRNHTRINAALDCERGDYEIGIHKMETLLHDKAFEIPVDVGQAPMFFPDENQTQDQALKPR